MAPLLGYWTRIDEPATPRNSTALPHAGTQAPSSENSSCSDSTSLVPWVLPSDRNEMPTLLDAPPSWSVQSSRSDTHPSIAVNVLSSLTSGIAKSGAYKLMPLRSPLIKEWSMILTGFRLDLLSTLRHACDSLKCVGDRTVYALIWLLRYSDKVQSLEGCVADPPPQVLETSCRTQAIVELRSGTASAMLCLASYDPDKTGCAHPLRHSDCRPPSIHPPTPPCPPRQFLMRRPSLPNFIICTCCQASLARLIETTVLLTEVSMLTSRSRHAVSRLLRHANVWLDTHPTALS